jgi:hypothetical protein
MAHIPLDECKNGYLYRISSRNLAFGVFREEVKGFIGIREKFGELFLFTEFHWDTGPPFGTVHPKEELEPVPEGLFLEESIDVVGDKSKRSVVFFNDWHYEDAKENCNEIVTWSDEGPIGKESNRRVVQGKNKGWKYVDTNEPVEGEHAVSVPNKALFNWLKEKEKEKEKEYSSEIN